MGTLSVMTWPRWISRILAALAGAASQSPRHPLWICCLSLYTLMLKGSGCPAGVVPGISTLCRVRYASSILYGCFRPDGTRSVMAHTGRPSALAEGAAAGVSSVASPMAVSWGWLFVVAPWGPLSLAVSWGWLPLASPSDWLFLASPWGWLPLAAPWDLLFLAVPWGSSFLAGGVGGCSGPLPLSDVEAWNRGCDEDVLDAGASPEVGRSLPAGGWVPDGGALDVGASASFEGPMSVILRASGGCSRGAMLPLG